jgi:hypothetical protein
MFKIYKLSSLESHQIVSKILKAEINDLENCD